MNQTKTITSKEKKSTQKGNIIYMIYIINKKVNN